MSKRVKSPLWKRRCTWEVRVAKDAVLTSPRDFDLVGWRCARAEAEKLAVRHARSSGKLTVVYQSCEEFECRQLPRSERIRCTKLEE